MIATKTITTIDFSSDVNTLTVKKSSAIASDEQLIFSISDPLGTTIYVNDGYDTNDFSDPDIDEATEDELVVNLSEDDDGEILQGTYTLEYKSSDGTKVSTGTITLNYCFAKPTIEVGLEYSCRSSSITSVDNSDYDVSCSCSGTDISPSVTRSHVVSYPTTMETPIADVEETTDTIIVTPIWTKYWVSRITSYLSYNMPTDCYSGDTQYFVTGTITGFNDATVVCDDCLCLLFDCISVVINAYFAKKETMSPYDLQKYKTTLFDLQTLYMQFKMTEGCSTEADTRAICGQMRAILNAWDCTCETTTSSPWSVEIVAITGVSGGSVVIGGTTWYRGSTVPSESLGNIDDFYLNITNGDIYAKTSAGWVVQFSMTLTALLSNYIMHEAYTPASTTSSTLTQLGAMSFDKTDVKDGTALVVESNFTIEEDTSSDTQIQLVFTGSTSETDNFSIDTTNDGTSFTASIKSTYYIEDTDSLGVLYLVAKKHELIVNDIIVKTVTTKGLSIVIADTSNAITVKAKTDGTEYISLDTIKIIQEQTNS